MSGPLIESGWVVFVKNAVAERYEWTLKYFERVGNALQISVYVGSNDNILTRKYYLNISSQHFLLLLP